MSRRRESFPANSTMAGTSLFDLPIEIRRIIYSYYYSPPYGQDLTASVIPTKPTSKQDDEDMVVTSEQPVAAVKKCQHVNSHLSLIQLNHQLRQEAYEFFAATHTLNFPNSLEFANEYLNSMTSHCLKSIKSLTLTWRIQRMCSASLPAPRSEQKMIDIKSSMYKFMQLLETYPELLRSVDRFGFVPSFRRACCHFKCDKPEEKMQGDLVRQSVMLCERINKILQSSQPDVKRQHFLVEIVGTQTWYITLRRVSKQVLDQIDDQDVIQKRDCKVYRAEVHEGQPCDHREHDGTFENVEQMLSAVKSSKLWQPWTRSGKTYPIRWEICVRGTKLLCFY